MEYIEKYIIAGTTFGIEDYEQPGDHFFPHRPHKRFKCWVIGCGICDGHDFIEEAREHLRVYAVERLADEIAKLTSRLAVCQEALTLLGDDPFASFREEERVEKND